MADDKDRLVTAQWVLERNLAWVAAAEVKVAVIVAIDTESWSRSVGQKIDGDKWSPAV